MNLPGLFPTGACHLLFGQLAFALAQFSCHNNRDRPSTTGRSVDVLDQNDQ
jgi:hypothetical protein